MLFSNIIFHNRFEEIKNLRTTNPLTQKIILQRTIRRKRLKCAEYRTLRRSLHSTCYFVHLDAIQCFINIILYVWKQWDKSSYSKNHSVYRSLKKSWSARKNNLLPSIERFSKWIEYELLMLEWPCMEIERLDKPINPIGGNKSKIISLRINI